MAERADLLIDRLDLSDDRYEGDGSVDVLIGHMPDLADFLGWLIGSRKAQIDMAKAGVAYVTCEDVRKGDGTLEWLLTPDWVG